MRGLATSLRLGQDNVMAGSLGVALRLRERSRFLAALGNDGQKSKSKGHSRSRFPAGMTERKATASAMATRGFVFPLIPQVRV